MDLAGVLLIVLMFALVGFVVYLIIKYIPMPDPFKQVIIVACVVLLVLYLITLVAPNGHLLLHR